MPYLTDWLEMPSASSQPGPSLFDPPALRSMGTRRGARNESMQAAQTQKMAAYQSALQKMEMRNQADAEARAVLPVLQSLDINSPDYIERRGQLFSQFPLSVESPAVSNVAKAHDDMLNGMRQQQESERRENEEDQKMLAEDPALQYLFSQKAKIEGPEAAMSAIRAKRFNDAQALRLIELGEDPENPKFKLDDQYFDKKQIDMLEAKKKGGGASRGIPNSVRDGYFDALAKSTDSFDPKMQAVYAAQVRSFEDDFPELKKYSSSLPADPPPTAAAQESSGGGYTVRSYKTKEEENAIKQEIAKLPPGTRVVMPDGTVKFKK